MTASPYPAYRFSTYKRKKAILADGLFTCLMPGSSLLSHGETPHYHRRYGVSLLSSAWERTVAVGEIGLDYYWDKEPNVQENQRYWFKRQLELAAEASLPVIIHSRDAAQDTMEIMTEAAKKNIRGVIHCYSYSPEMALEYVKLGYYIGVGGVVTFKNAKKLVQTVSELPLDRILLETDCPYMAPEPHRGTRNDSSNIPYVISKIAEIKGTTPDEVERKTRANAFELFTRVSD